MTAATYTYSARPNPETERRQRCECEALADKLGHAVAHAYSDAAGDRTNLSTLLANAADGKVQVLIVASVDRLGRDATRSAQTLSTLDDAGVTIYAADTGVHPVSERSSSLAALVMATSRTALERTAR